MIAFFLLLALLASAGSGQVFLTGELGWDDRAVSTEINPLWVQARNEGSATINGQLIVQQRIGSAWRGEADRLMRLPAPLAPGSEARWVLPWHLGPGGTTLTVTYEAADEVLARYEIPFHLATQPLELHVGRLTGEAAPGTVVRDPGALPLELAVYSGIAAVTVDPTLRLPANVQAVLDGWEVLLAGEQGGPTSVPHPSSEELREVLADASLESGRWWAFLIGTAGFLLSGMWLLRRWAQGVARWPGVALGALLGIVLSASVLYETPLRMKTHKWSFTHDTAHRFCVEWCGLFSRQDREVWLQGLWVDLLAADEVLADRHLTWTWGQEGWETRASLVGGEVRTLWTIGAKVPPQTAAGWETSTVSPAWAWLEARPGPAAEAGFFLRTVSGEGMKEVEHHVHWSTTP